MNVHSLGEFKLPLIAITKHHPEDGHNFSKNHMPDLNQKFAKEMLIDCLAELGEKYRSRMPAAVQCISCIATAMRTGEVENLAQFMRIFESSINHVNGKGNHAKP